MMHAEFTDNLITGNETIDTQHKELIGHFNKLLKSCEKGNEKLVAVNTLDYLSDYTDTHFATEEGLQKEVGYPGYEQHLSQHAIFRKTIEELQEMLQEEEGPSDVFVEKVEKNLVNWFCVHIEGFDRSVAEFISIRHNNERL